MRKNMKFIIIYSTFKNKKEADKIVQILLDKKLIACANYLNIESRYNWKGKVSNVKEIACFFKTKKGNWNKVKKCIEENHSYEIPCIINFSEVEANKEYTNWILNETK